MVASALCLALAAFGSFAGQNGGKGAMEHDPMGKPDTHDKMGKTDKMGKKDKTAKHDKMDKHDQMDKMEKPGAMQ